MMQKCGSKRGKGFGGGGNIKHCFRRDPALGFNVSITKSFCINKVVSFDNRNRHTRGHIQCKSFFNERVKFFDFCLKLIFLESK